MQCRKNYLLYFPPARRILSPVKYRSPENFWKLNCQIQPKTTIGPALFMSGVLGDNLRSSRDDLQDKKLDVQCAWSGCGGDPCRFALFSSACTRQKRKCVLLISTLNFSRTFFFLLFLALRFVSFRCAAQCGAPPPMIQRK